MVISIISAKVTFSRIGITANSSGTPGVTKSAIFIPRVSISIEGRKAAKTGYLSGKTKFGRFEKN